MDRLISLVALAVLLINLDVLGVHGSFSGPAFTEFMLLEDLFIDVLVIGTMVFVVDLTVVDLRTVDFLTDTDFSDPSSFKKKKSLLR